MAGEDEMIADAMNQLYLMLLLAVIFIYLVMVAPVSYTHLDVYKRQVPVIQ